MTSTTVNQVMGEVNAMKSFPSQWCVNSVVIQQTLTTGPSVQTNQEAMKIYIHKKMSARNRLAGQG